ncbi:MAG: archaeosine biosynthesis radical SAM protein RaSEA [Candidatus Hodarchaeales archaeon]|jgi:radical SAM enzyme (TIGR01210 family)
MGNKTLISAIKRIRFEYLINLEDDKRPKIWSNITEKDHTNIITLVIPSRGCSWALSDDGGCSVCGYVNDASRDKKIPIEMILDRIESLIVEQRLDKPVTLQIFNSGSFFDRIDVPRELRANILDIVIRSGQVSKLSVECRPEYIIKEKSEILEFKRKLLGIELEIGVGLESSNEAILRDCWNKGTSFESYLKSITTLHSMGIKVKSYIFIKSPFLNERDSLIDTISTIKAAYEAGTDVISLNPCNIQHGTLVNKLFKQHLFSSPWLWSVLTAVKAAKSIAPDLEIICEPSAGGKPRGAHNCGKCDKEVLNYIQLLIDGKEIPSNLEEVCTCYLNWEILLNSPWELFRIRNHSKLRKLNPLSE